MFVIVLSFAVLFSPVLLAVVLTSHMSPRAKTLITGGSILLLLVLPLIYFVLLGA